MGAKDSKPENPHNKDDALAEKPDLQLFGRRTEFWFLIDNVNISRIKSTKDVHLLVLKLLRGWENQIVGTYLVIDDGSNEVQAFVYTRDFKSAERAAAMMNLMYLEGHQVITSCMPKPIESNETKVQEGIDEETQRESLDAAISVSLAIQAQQQLLEQAKENQQLEEGRSRQRKEQMWEKIVLERETSESEIHNRPQESYCERESGRELLEQQSQMPMVQQKEKIMLEQERIRELLEQQRRQELLELQHKQQLLESERKRELQEQLHEQKILEQKRREEILKQQHKQQLLEVQMKQELLEKQLEHELLEQERQQEILIKQHEQKLLERQRRREQLEQDLLEEQRRQELNERVREEELLDRQQKLRFLVEQKNQITFGEQQRPEILEQHKREISGQQQKILRTSGKTADLCVAEEAESLNHRSPLAKQKGTAVSVFSGDGESNYYAIKIEGRKSSREDNTTCRKVITESGSHFSPSLVRSREVATSEKVESWLDTQNRYSSCNSMSSASSGLGSKENSRNYLPYDSTEEQPDATSVTTDGESVSSGAANKRRKAVCSVTVSCLPDFVTVKMLKDCFKNECQGVKTAYLTKKRGCGGVIFNTQEQMETCVEKMNKTFRFGHKIRVRPKPPSKTQNDEKKEPLGVSQQQKQLLQQPRQQQEQQPAPRRRRRRRRRGGRKNKQLPQNTSSSQENRQNSSQVGLSLENNDDDHDSASSDSSFSENVHGISSYYAEELTAAASDGDTDSSARDATASSFEATRVNPEKSPKRTTQEKENRSKKSHYSKSPSKKETLSEKKFAEKSKKLTVNLDNVPQPTSVAELEGFMTRLCEGVEILELERSGGIFTVKLESESDCKILCETLDQRTFNGEVITATWKN